MVSCETKWLYLFIIYIRLLDWWQFNERNKLLLTKNVHSFSYFFLINFFFTQDGWNNCIAGGLAGLTIAIEDPTRRRVVTLFAIARAFGGLISTMVVRGKLPQIEYSETALFCLCSSFLLYAVSLQPKLLFTGYYYSVLKWSRDYTDQKLNILFRDTGDKFLTCNEVGLHKDGCMKHAIKDFFYSIPAFAKLYMPIHVAPIIIFRRKLLFQRYVLFILYILT